MSAIEEDMIEGCDWPNAVTARQKTPSAVVSPEVMIGVVSGVLIGFKDDGQTPLVLYPGQPGRAAKSAASIVDLHGAHVGRQVLMMFEHGDPHRPVIVGLLKTAHSVSLAEQAGQVEVDADGERLVVTAKQQLVLRCGKASITLTKAGKVLVQGTYVSQRSAGVMRIKGGSVQIN